MLTLLKIQNIALIDQLELEFGVGLNLLTGETGSGKSIIVDSLAALTGERVSTDLIKQGQETARIEGLFLVGRDTGVDTILNESGIEIEGDEIIVRRELSASGRNRVFVNNQLVTQGFLKGLGPYLADIHGQGEQAALYDVESHIQILDGFGSHDKELGAVAAIFAEWRAIKDSLATLEKDRSEKLQLIDVLRFQVNEISQADLKLGEDDDLETEKRRVANAERLSTLSDDVHKLLYDDENSALATLDRAAKAVAELSTYEKDFAGFDEGLAAARAVITDLGTTARDFGSTLEFVPGRLDEIETRLAEITRLRRKYGDSIDEILTHLATSQDRLANIETVEFREQELSKGLEAASAKFESAAAKLTSRRNATARLFEKAIEQELRTVALEKGRFEVRIAMRENFSPTGADSVEFYFSANPGEAPKPLAKVASGGEASRLMLILKTVSRSVATARTAVFDEIDIGIGGRVAEAVGRKLKALSATQQVLCVTHQPQIASLADHHFVVEKDVKGKSTSVTVKTLSRSERVDELARMLAGEQVTEAARENARTMLASAN